MFLFCSPILFIQSIILIYQHICVQAFDINTNLPVFIMYKHLTQHVYVQASNWSIYVNKHLTQTHCTSTQTSPLPHCIAFPRTAHDGQPKHPVDPGRPHLAPIWHPMQPNININPCNMQFVIRNQHKQTVSKPYFQPNEPLQNPTWTQFRQTCVICIKENAQPYPS